MADGNHYKGLALENNSTMDSNILVGLRMDYLDLVIQGVEFHIEVQRMTTEFYILNHLVFPSYWKLLS